MPHVAGPQRQHQISRPRLGDDRRHGGGVVRRVLDVPHPLLARALHDHGSRNPGQRRFAGGVHVQHPHAIRVGEGRAEFVRQRLGSRIAMRLEDRQHAPAQPARHAQGGADLGRMVGIVVHHADPGRLAAGLEPPRHAMESPEGLADVGETDFELETHGHRGERIEGVVLPGHVKLDRAQIAPLRDHPEVRSLGSHAQLNATHLGVRAQAVEQGAGRHPRQDPADLPIVHAQDRGAVERHAVGELHERLANLFDSGVVLEVLAVDVRHHRHRRRQAQEGAIALVRLGDQEAAKPQSSVRAERSQPPADHDRRIEAAARQDRRDERGGGGLAVSAADRDAVLHTHQLGEHVRPCDHRHAGRAGRHHLGVVRVDRGREDDHLGPLHVGRCMPDEHASAEARDSLRGLGRLEVAARDLVAHGEQHLGDPRHAGAADSDQVNAMRAPVHQPSSPTSPLAAGATRRPPS